MINGIKITSTRSFDLLVDLLKHLLQNILLVVSEEQVMRRDVGLRRNVVILVNIQLPLALYPRVKGVFLSLELHSF